MTDMASNENDAEPRDTLPMNEAESSVAGETPEQTIARLEAELAEAKDRTLRTQAEMDNVRKRLRREMDDERRYAEGALLTDMLPVVDNLARAVSATEKSQDVSGLLAGVKLVAQQLESVFAKHHCVRIPAQDQPFDPDFHSAIGRQPAADKPENTIIIVAQEGYKLHDRVLRPSQVIVSAAVDAAAQQGAQQ